MDSDNYSVLGNQDKIISNYNIMNTKSSTGKGLQRTIIKEKLNKSEPKLSRISGGKILDEADEEQMINKRILKQMDVHEEKLNRVYKTTIGN